MAVTSAYYSAAIEDFLKKPDNCIAALARQGAAEGSVEGPQMGAWDQQMDCLQEALRGMRGYLFLEFVVPRIGTRVDAIVVSGPVLFVIEFKMSMESKAAKKGKLTKRPAISGGYNQVWDYALDLKNFHKASHNLPIVPILVSSDITKPDTCLSEAASDHVYRPLQTNYAGLRYLMDLATQTIPGPAIDIQEWKEASYQPTPSIIEAAQAVFSGNAVDNILLNEAKENLGNTFKSVENIIASSKKNGEKAICFVTGVPGAGKTLVGMQIAGKRRAGTQLEHATFLSGNMPLVEVLSEALVRDRVQQARRRGEKCRVGEVRDEVNALIQHKMHFRDAGLRDRGKPPSDRIVIFDEAQRAWNMQQTRNFMLRKRKKEMRELKLADFPYSEPEFLLKYMDHHQGWAVVICLVGGGQEIHDGEAGISEWLKTAREKFKEWKVYVSPELGQSEFQAEDELRALQGHPKLVEEKELHLAVSNRSFRAENVSLFVRALLDCDRHVARETLRAFSEKYPIRLTRDIGKAKEWIRKRARGTERYGVLASSSAHRLKPDAVNVKEAINSVHWFLNPPEDTRSSFYLEDPATEFQVQGLELDWALVAWDGDFRRTGHEWVHRSFVGSDWRKVKKEEHQRYLKNTYRVLLTRARQGMVIYVPMGSRQDPTRRPEYYDGTFEYLEELGIEVI
jgi:hypothetical protein